jgi:hypothetical protein
MGHFHYKVTTVQVETDPIEEGSNLIYHEDDDKCKPRDMQLPVEPGWKHVNPISTQIDLESVADQLSNFKYAPGMNITVDDLLNPPYCEYDPNAANW